MKTEFGEELFSFTGSFSKAVSTSLKENRIEEVGKLGLILMVELVQSIY